MRDKINVRMLKTNYSTATYNILTTMKTPQKC